MEHRTFSGIILCLDVTVGNCIGVGVAYCVSGWRMLILAVSAPLVLSVIAWWYRRRFRLKALRNETSWFKSALLLQVASRIRKVALGKREGRRCPPVHPGVCPDERQNGAPGDAHAGTSHIRLWHCWNVRAGGLLFSQTLLESAETQRPDKKYTFLDMFKTPQMRKLTVCMGLIW